MPATYDTVLRLALALPGVSEGRSYGTPSLHVGRKLMARLWEDGETLVVKIDPAERVRLLNDFPDTFFLTDHYLEHPYVLVNLLAVAPGQLSPLLEGAWQMVASKQQVARWAALADRKSSAQAKRAK